MTHILHIDASANTTTSTSRAASAKLVADVGGTVTYRDLAVTPLPQIDGAWADARLTDPETRSADDAARLKLSDEIVAEACGRRCHCHRHPDLQLRSPCRIESLDGPCGAPA